MLAADLAAPPRRPAPALLERPAVLWLLVGLGLAGTYLLRDASAVWRDLDLPDTDDAMRLVEVRDLLAGQPWFDLVQHRHLPPGAPPMHWSRFVDLPIAALIRLLGPVAGAQAEAAAVMLWPLLLFGLYAGLLYRGVRDLFGTTAATLALFAATQTVLVAALFGYGRIDHHNVQICTMLAMVLCLMRPACGLREGALAGGLAAFSLAVGLETLPTIACAGLGLAGAWILAGRAALPAFLGFGLALGLGGLALFSAQTAPALWRVTACDALSPPWLWLGGCAALTALAAAGLDRRLPGPGPRLALAAAAGAATLAGFAALFPDCLHGPFPGMPGIVRREWLDENREMMPLPAALAFDGPQALAVAMPVYLAALAALAAAWRERDPRRRWAWGLLGAVLTVGAVIGTTQIRGFYVAAGFVPVVAGPVLARAVALLGPAGAGRPVLRRAGALLLGLALVGKVWFALATLPALAGLRERAADPVEGCLAAAPIRALGALPPGLVLGEIYLGPHILALTRHSVVAAPYHRATEGLLASLEALKDEASLRRVAEAMGVNYIALCAPSGPFLDGSSLAAHLMRDGASRPWLERIPMQNDALAVWRVQQSAPAAARRRGASSPGA
ncbi:hypothetical protein [Methylobacterium oryzihabitans]|uniref:Glycosyltransferase RgtA/B/C/D-like domain-containing protein n=1 Tax=Methylobacterium oryzihabitans TaxID=2499852 RepID=A0A437P6E3_9HYPH|nr:hypothetical protein [Methylobacterium oryzihabitans]RVU17708.1 hypothetical protein EOE48_12560 [Methylobacterium oryzihabitans]